MERDICPIILCGGDFEDHRAGAVAAAGNDAFAGVSGAAFLIGGGKRLQYMLAYTCPCFGTENFSVFKIGDVLRRNCQFLTTMKHWTRTGFGVIEIAALKVGETFAPEHLNFA